MGVDGDEGVVRGTSTKGSGTGVEHTLDFGTLGGTESSVLAAIDSVVCRLEIASLPLVVGVMTDKEVPREVWVFRDPGMEGRDGVVDICSLVITSFDEKRLVTSERKTSS